MSHKATIYDLTDRSFSPLLGGVVLYKTFVERGYRTKHVDLSIHTQQFLREKQNYEAIFASLSVLHSLFLRFLFPIKIFSQTKNPRLWLFLSIMYENQAYENFGLVNRPFINALKRRLIKLYGRHTHVPFLLRKNLFGLSGFIDSKSDISAISTRYLQHMKIAEQLAKHIKQLSSSKVLVGGYPVKYFSAINPIISSHVDEFSSNELVTIVGGSKTKSLSYVDAYRFIAAHYHKMYGNIERVYYQTSYGCMWRKCVFCSFYQLGDQKRYHAKEVYDVLDELQKIVGVLNVNKVWFINDYMDVKYAKKLSEEIIRRGTSIEWLTYFRFGRDISYKLLKKLRKSGCFGLRFGLESGSQTVNDKLAKGVVVEDAQQILEWCKKLDIKATVFAMVGLPFESSTQLLKTYSFFIKNSKNIDTIHIGRFNLMPKSHMHQSPSHYKIASLEPYTFRGQKIRYLQIYLLNVILLLYLRFRRPQIKILFE